MQSKERENLICFITDLSDVKVLGFYKKIGLLTQTPQTLVFHTQSSYLQSTTTQYINVDPISGTIDISKLSTIRLNFYEYCYNKLFDNIIYYYYR